MKKKFYGYQFVVRYLHTDNDDEVRDMFRRLESVSCCTEAPRAAKCDLHRSFVRLTLTLADNKYRAENRIVTAAGIRRMNDVEYVSELLIGLLHGPQGGGAAIIDEYYKQYEDYRRRVPDQKRTARLFEQTLTSVQEVLPNIKETRWSNKTDFYTLFIALGSLFRSSDLISGKGKAAQKALSSFETGVNSRLANDQYKANEDVVWYLQAIEKGANDKKRRADRHDVMVKLLTPFFRPRIEKRSARKRRYFFGFLAAALKGRLRTGASLSSLIKPCMRTTYYGVRAL